MLGWGLVLGVVAIAGLPPLGIFMSEFLVVSSTFARQPWLAVILVVAILVALGGLFLRLNSVAFGEPRGPSAPAKASYVPMFAHLALVFMAGIYMPPALCSRSSPLCSWAASICRQRSSPASRTSRGCWGSAMAVTRNTAAKRVGARLLRGSRAGR